MIPPPSILVQELIRVALAEDNGLAGDITAQSIFGPSDRAQGTVVARKPGVISGIGIAASVFEAVDPSIQCRALVNDGDQVPAKTELLRVSGPAASILTAERTALNFLGHLSGIATLTAAFVKEIQHTKAILVDTRKTLPGLRALEKYAVRCGGGFNHRFGLFDGVMIKDNHIAALGSIDAAVKAVRSRVGHMLKINVEVDRLDQVEDAVAAGADIVLLDNMSLEELHEAVALINGRAIVEASGGVNLNTIRAIAETGVGVISSGAITHSAPYLDVALDIAP